MKNTFNPTLGYLFSAAEHGVYWIVTLALGFTFARVARMAWSRKRAQFTIASRAFPTWRAIASPKLNFWSDSMTKAEQERPTREQARAIIQKYADECAFLEGSGQYASDADASEVEALLDALYPVEVRPNA